MSKTKIDWCDEVWNPVTGCSKISEGCKNCYAEKMAARLQKMGLYKYRNGFKVECHDDEFEKHFPSKGKRIFVNSMSDLFHPEVPFDFVDSVFTEISKHNNRHVFIILTKRPERMKEYLTSDRSNHKFAGYMCWPLKNLWLGVSVENQKAADERIPLLLQTPAALRFVSVEPMLEKIDLDIWGGDYFCPLCDNFFDNPANWLSPCCGAETNGGDDYNCPECGECFAGIGEIPECPHCGNSGGLYIQPDGSGCFRANERLKSIDWVICGGESGANSRPLHPDWVRSLRNQCTSAQIPFFFKQWGNWEPIYDREKDDPDWRRIPGEIPGKVCCMNVKGGQGFHGERVTYFKKLKVEHVPLLDGQRWDQMPEII